MSQRKDTLSADTQANCMLDAAHSYAASGVPVFPLRGKMPAVPKAEGGNGFKDATTDPAQIQAWWTRWPDANIGAPTGAVSGFDVLDADNLDALRDLQGERDLATRTVKTGKGLHLYFRHAEGISNKTGALPAGIDLRGDGGYVVLPPSVHPDGQRYEFANDLPAAEWPDWLLALVRQPERKRAKRSVFDRTIRTGERNVKLTQMAGTLRARYGTPEAALFAALQGLNATMTEEPLPDSELATIARSIGSYPTSAPTPRELPAFPLDVFPADIQAFIAAAAESSNVPPEFAGAPLLAFAGAVVGNTRRLQLKADWTEYGGLWVAIVAPSGSGKSPTLKKVAALTGRLQASAIDVYEQERARWYADKKAKDVDEGPEPVAEHFMTSDTTPEALAEMLSTSPGIVIERDELAGWVRSFNQYRSSKGDERQKFLSLWSNVSIKIDRKKSPPVFVRNPVISVVGGIQPDVLPDLSDEAGRRDGFIERMLFVYPKVRTMRWNKTELSEALIAPVAALFRNLRRSKLPATAKGHEVYCLATEAEARWLEWFDATMQRAELADGIERGALAKAPNQAARIALNLHLLTDLNSAEIPLATLEGALRLWEFFAAHSRYALDIIDPRRASTRVLTVLQERDDWLSWTNIDDATNHNAKGLGKILDGLVADGLVEHRVVPTATKRRSEWRAISLNQHGEYGGFDDFPVSTSANAPGGVETGHYGGFPGEAVQAESPVIQDGGFGLPQDLLVDAENGDSSGNPPYSPSENTKIENVSDDDPIPDVQNHDGEYGGLPAVSEDPDTADPNGDYGELPDLRTQFGRNAPTCRPERLARFKAKNGIEDDEDDPFDFDDPDFDLFGKEHKHGR